MKGIDVSRYQGKIDFEAVKRSGIDFVIIRAGFGRVSTQIDPMFEQNYNAAKSAGLHVGAYWFSYADSPETAEIEASVFIQAIKGKQFDFPVYYDLENEPSSNYYPLKRGSEFCSSLVKAFCNKLEDAGYWAGLYMSRSPLESVISKEVASRYAVWVAEYAKQTSYKGQYGIWQYSSTGIVPGINGNVDMDIANIDYPTQIRQAGLNGFTAEKKAEIAKPKATATPKKTEPVTYTVVKGDTLTAIAKKYKTTVAALTKKNNIKDANKIYVGQKLTI